jgi:hypothetical protein
MLTSEQEADAVELLSALLAAAAKRGRLAAAVR